MTDILTKEQFKALKKKKQSKYGNKKVAIDGIPFDSNREAERYKVLRLMEKAGEIAELRRQVTFPLYVNSKLVCSYKADFVYWDLKSGKEIAEDSKGFRTKDYRLKAKLFEAVKGFKILET